MKTQNSTLSEEDNKCWACSLELSSDQQKCHRCDHWQNWRKYVSFLNTTVLALITAILSITTVLFPIVTEWLENPIQHLDIFVVKTHGNRIELIVSNSTKRAAQTRDLVVCIQPIKPILSAPKDKKIVHLLAVYELGSAIGVGEAISYPVLFPEERYRVELLMKSASYNFGSFKIRHKGKLQNHVASRCYFADYISPGDSNGWVNIDDKDWRNTLDSFELQNSDWREIFDYVDKHFPIAAKQIEDIRE